MPPRRKKLKLDKLPPKLKPELTLPTIPYELIPEILSYLPGKSQVRFQMVCKSWNSLISNLYRSRPTSNSGLLYISRKQPPFNVSSLPVKFLLKTDHSTIGDESRLICTLESYHDIIGSCNGLVCLLGTRSNNDKNVHWVCFLNPTTRLISHKSPDVAFKKIVSYDSSYGFGYDRMSNTYKVVLLPDYRSRYRQEIKVFSMGGSKWRDTRFMRLRLRSINHNRIGVHLNGTLNWLATRGKREDEEPFEWGWDSDIIFSFDLNKENYAELLLPDVSHTFRYANIGILGDCLCVSDDDRKSRDFIVWQMKKFGVYESWTKLLNISYGILQPDLLRFSSRFPLCMFDNGDVLMHQERLLYNHEDDRLDHLKFPKKMFCKAMTYSKSMVSPLV